MKDAPNIPIYLLRGRHVMLDRDLATVYEVETGNLNKAVLRNPRRFPEEFTFVVPVEAVRGLIFQIGRSKGRGGRRKPVRVFTEHGALMAATVLRSALADRMCAYIVRAFIRMRQELSSRVEWERRLERVEATLVGHDAALRNLYDRIRPLLLPPPDPPRPRIGFHRGDE